MRRALRALREVGVSFAASELRVLCHHEVRSRERFHAQMSVLIERGYFVITMDELIGWARRGQSVRSPAVLLTFDGGYRSQIDNAFPVLDALKHPATFFPSRRASTTRRSATETWSRG